MIQPVDDDIAKSLGLTVVLVTHELESAFKIADRLTVLDQGRLVATGTVEEVRSTDNDRVQGLLHRKPREDSVDADEYLRRLTNHSRRL